MDIEVLKNLLISQAKENKVDWAKLCMSSPYEELGDDFLKRLKKIPFEAEEKLRNEERIEEYKNKIEENADTINWKIVSASILFKDLPYEFIHKFIDDWHWETISKEQFLTPEFIIEFRNKINWHELQLNSSVDFEKLPINLIKTKIYSFQTLILQRNFSENFLRKVINKNNYKFIISFQKNISPQFKEELVKLGYENVESY